MKIIYTDGSILEASVVFIEGNNINADDIYIVPIEEILRIED